MARHASLVVQLESGIDRLRIARKGILLRLRAIGLHGGQGRWSDKQGGKNSNNEFHKDATVVYLSNCAKIPPETCGPSF